MAQFWPAEVHLAPPADALAAPEAEVQRLVWAVAGVFVAASVVSSALLIRGHLNHFTQPIVQSKVRERTLQLAGQNGACA
jgi:hypothetical protein